MLVSVITIDGPSGSGKGTLAKAVADELGWHLLDSGALYRIIGCMCVRAGVDLDTLAGVLDPIAAEIAEGLSIQFCGDRVVVDNLDVTDEIRTEDAGTHASKVAALPLVREAVLELQHALRKSPGLVADGRDMGTVVFPDAQLKFFLEASPDKRAERRYKQLKNKGLSVNLRDLLEQILERDARDRGRAIAPLRPADDAVMIDSTSMSIEAVFEFVMSHIRECGL
ncbi:MAG: (d)CMP kinase [Gammaproteobacteria bacterium]|nr:(d)CMP kinase [Gammaproteobacteria bacterium]